MNYTLENITVAITEPTVKKVKETLLSIFDFDNDMNGNNGEDYTMDIALKKGYTSTNAYLVDKHIQSISTDEIENAITEFFESVDKYCAVGDIFKVKNTIVIGISYIIWKESKN